MANPVVHWEFWSKDPAAAEFYAEVFGWNIRHIPEMNYRMVHTESEDGIDGGIMQPDEGPWPAQLAFYISVDDIAEYQDRITAAGGTLVVEEQEVPGMGWFSLFADPEGRVLGIWKEAPRDEEE